MNPELLSILHAEVDGTATPEQIARLEAAAASDQEILTLRDEHREIARAVSRMDAPEAPFGFSGRVMAALPPTLPVRESAPISDRILSILRDLVPVQRHRVAFAFAAVIIVLVGIGLVLTDISQPGADAVSATIAGRSDIELPFSGNTGIVRISPEGDRLTVAVEPVVARQIRISIAGATADAPSVTVDETLTPVSVTRSGDTVVLDAGETDIVRFTIDQGSAIQIRVESGDQILVDWTSIEPGS